MPVGVARPLAVSGSAGSGPSSAIPAPRVPIGAVVGTSVAGSPLPAVPAAPAAPVSAGAPTSPSVGKAPELLGSREARDPATVLPSGALDRAASVNPEAEAQRRRRDEAAFLEREAEAGVLRQFLRRVLRLDPPVAPAAPAAPAPPVSEPGR